jgi:hypothetical protein
MHDPAVYHKHPFVLETFYREMAAMITNSDLSDPSAVLKPMIDVYRKQEDAWTKQALQRLPLHVKKILNREIGQPWWRMMPMVLPPFQSNHELSLVYALYRLMTSGNMTFMIGPELSTALFNTDYEIRVDELTFPSDTFVVYYRDSEIPVYGRPLKWLFCDRIRYHEGHRELRLVYGYIDTDGDYVNSGFQLLTYSDDTVIRSAELDNHMEKETVSSLSLMDVTDEHRTNTRNISASLFNFLLYLGSVNDQTIVNPPDYRKRLVGLKNPKKRRRLEKEIQDQTIYRYTYVGRGYESRLKEEPRGTGTDLAHRVLVRGHWRHQWIGKQRDDEGNRIPGTSQRLAWIEPYWKGPEARDEKISVRVVR